MNTVYMPIRVDARGSINIPLGVKQSMGLLPGTTVLVRQFGEILIVVPFTGNAGEAQSRGQLDQWVGQQLGRDVPPASVQPSKVALAEQVRLQGSIIRHQQKKEMAELQAKLIQQKSDLKRLAAVERLQTQAEMRPRSRRENFHAQMMAEVEEGKAHPPTPEQQKENFQKLLREAGMDVPPPAPAAPAPVTIPWEQFRLPDQVRTVCSLCGQPQSTTLAGVVCPNGHKELGKCSECLLPQYETAEGVTTCRNKHDGAPGLEDDA